MKRIYVVDVNGTRTLVRAAHKQQAVAHVAKSLISAHLASQDELINMVSAGAKVEDTGADEEAVELIEESESPAN